MNEREEVNRLECCERCGEPLALCGCWSTDNDLIGRLRQQLAEARADLQDAAMLIRRLAYRVPGLAVATKANEWLRRKGLQGSVLRETEDSNG